MKTFLITLLSSLLSLGAYPQNISTTQKESPAQKVRILKSGDSVRVIADSSVVQIRNNGEKKQVEILFEYGKSSIDKYLKDSVEAPTKPIESEKESPFFASLTFSNFDLGLTKLLDDGDLSLSPENKFLDYKTWKTINVGFDALHMGFKFTDQFKVSLAAGFDWTHIRLKQDILFLEDTDPLSYVESDIDYKKNRFTSSYLRIPLAFEVRTKSGALPRRIYFAAGPMAGILLKGSQKLKSKEEGKRKVKDDFNFAPLTYGAFGRLSYGSVGIYVKYYFNDMFVDSPDQQNLRNLSFGLMLDL